MPENVTGSSGSEAVPATGLRLALRVLGCRCQLAQKEIETFSCFPFRVLSEQRLSARSRYACRCVLQPMPAGVFSLCLQVCVTAYACRCVL